MATDWKIDWYICRADASDARELSTKASPVKAGDELWRAAQAIGPISFDHSHWGGIICQLNAPQTEWVARACAAYETAGNTFPDPTP